MLFIIIINFITQQKNKNNIMNKNIKFIPWVGSQYAKGISGKRVLVLGESHYCAHESEALPQITINIIHHILNPDSEHEGFMNTYTKFGRALAGSEQYNKDREAVWNSILFYNFVQVPISEARKAPKKQDFVDATFPFFTVLEQYKPDCVIVWGSRLYNNLPRRGYQTEDLKLLDGKINETWAYELSDGHKVSLLPITHPSARFTPEYWHQAITNFVER